MTNQLSVLTPNVIIHDGKAVTSSQNVAEYFHKLHKNVIQKIETLDCSSEFMTANFSAVVVTVQAGFNEREAKAYEMTKDGFVFLVMGFTGKKAAKFKEDYISAFNSMEQQLLKQHNAIVAPISGRVLTYYENGVVTGQRIISDDLHIATLEEFLEMAERAKYLVIDIDRLKEISLTRRVKS